MAGFLSPESRFQRAVRSLKRKQRTTSGWKLLFSVLNFVLSLVVVYIPVHFAYTKLANRQPSDIVLAWVLIGAAFYTGIYKVFLSNRFKPKRLDREVERRPIRLGVGLSRLATLFATDQVTATTVSDIERAALVSIQSEAEAHAGDIEGLYINVNLLVPHPHDSEKMLCLNRAGVDRPFPRTYSKEGLFAWECMERMQKVHKPDYSMPGKPYHSVLCFPIIYSSGDVETCVGAVTIDCEERYYLSDLEAKLEIVLQPYLQLLSITLLIREQRALWPL